MNPKVDFFFSKESKWQSSFQLLRTIILDCSLTEELKWGVPCYTFQNGNVVLIHGFKEYCAILFVKGALLKDPKSILIQQTENVQSARQIRFTNLNEISKLRATIKSYIKEAIEIERAGLKIELKKKIDSLPEELESIFKVDHELKKAFFTLTPGRQRAYIMFFNSAKQSSTRLSRIEKSRAAILSGKGLND